MEIAKKIQLLSLEEAGVFRVSNEAWLFVHVQLQELVDETVSRQVRDQLRAKIWDYISSHRREKGR